MKQAIAAWCNKNNCSDWTFFRIFNIPTSLYFYLNSPPKFKSKKYENFVQTVQDALQTDVTQMKIVERIQEYCQNLIHQNAATFRFHVDISYNDEEMYICFYDKNMVSLDLFFQLAKSRFTEEMVQDLKRGECVFIDNVQVGLQLRELW